jgi:hypothetical protein
LEIIDWISDLISRPVKEYTQFEAGLSLIPVLPPEDAIDLLMQRCTCLEMEIAQKRSHLQLDAEQMVARLHLIESEYVLAMQEAELAWTRHFAEAIRLREMEGVTEWAASHRTTAEQKHNASQEPIEHE